MRNSWRPGQEGGLLMSITESEITSRIVRFDTCYVLLYVNIQTIGGLY